MILGELPDIIKRCWALIGERQWGTWQLLAIAAVAVVVFLLLMVILRRLKNTSRRWKSVKAIAEQPGLTDKERVRLLQHEIIKRDHTEAHVEQEISELTAANKDLRSKIAELTKISELLKKTNSRNELSATQKVTELIILCEQLRREVTAGREARGSSERKIASLVADNKQLQDRVNELIGASEQLQARITEMSHANEQLQVQATELTRSNEQLRHEVTGGKESHERSERKLASLTADNEQLQSQVNELTGANEQFRHEVTGGKENHERSERKIASLTADNEKLQSQVNELTGANEQLRQHVGQTRESTEQKVAELTHANEQFQEEITARKKALESSREKIAALTVANEQLRDELDEYMKAAGKEVPDRPGGRVPHNERIMLVSEIGVKAKSPTQQLRELAEDIVESNSRENIPDGPDARRQAIQEACDYLDADNKAMAVEALKKFISAVEAQQGTNGNISHKEEADDWIGAAREVIYQLTAE